MSIERERALREAQERQAWLAGCAMTLAVVLRLCWTIPPVFVDDYVIQDEAAEQGRNPALGDAEVEEVTRSAALATRSGVISIEALRVKTSGSTRTIVIEYVRQVAVLPGVPIPFRFKHKLEVQIAVAAHPPVLDRPTFRRERGEYEDQA